MKQSLFPASSRQRGSVLIVAMMFSAIIGISLVSYMQLGRTSLKISNNALYNNAAMNLAENGLEEAMYAINQRIADPNYDWSANGWTTSSPVPAGDARRTLPSSGAYAFDQGVTGTVRVYVRGYTGSAPRIVSRATITIPRGGTIEKWVEVQLRKTSKFANGLVAKESIQFKGNNASVDSWHSKKNDDGSLRATPVNYSSAVKKDNGSVGSVSIQADAILVQNADIWGYAATGGTQPSVGAQGLIGPFGTPVNTIDPTRVSTDFSASFDAVTAPTTTNYNLGGIGTNMDLPRAGDVPHTDGVYYYEASSIDFNNKLLHIKKRSAGESSPKVVIKLTNAVTSIKIGGGSGELRIESGANLEIYAPGDITIAGNGIMNDGGLPENFQIWGTKTSGVQSIDVKGNGALSALVYAPQGSVKINGNGDVLGSIVANDITLVGNAAFHYDESLADFGGNDPFRISLWREITTAAGRNALTELNW